MHLLTFQLIGSHVVTENIQLRSKWKFIELRFFVLVTLHMMKSEVTQDIRSRTQDGENIGIVGKLPFGNQVADMGDIAYCTGAIDIECKGTPNGERVVRS